VNACHAGSFTDSRENVSVVGIGCDRSTHIQNPSRDESGGVWNISMNTYMRSCPSPVASQNEISVWHMLSEAASAVMLPLSSRSPVALSYHATW